MITLLAGVFAGVLLAVAYRNRQAWSKQQRVGALGIAFLCLVLAAAVIPGGYVIQKVVARLAMPIGLVWTAMFVSFLLGIATKNRGLATAAGVLWLALTLTGSSLVGGYLAYQLESAYQPLNLQKVPEFDAVLVLGGGTSFRNGYAQVADSGDRVLLGARLYHAGKTPTLLTSGSSIAGLGLHHDSAQTTTELWTSLGVPEDAIMRVPDPKNTKEEIAALAGLMKDHGWKRVGLVTSAWHMRRAMKLAQRNQLDVTPLPADFRGDLDYEGILSFIPDPQGVTWTYRVCWELLGAAVGR